MTKTGSIRAFFLSTGLLALSLAGCDLDTPDYEPDAPPLHAQKLLATTALLPDGSPDAPEEVVDNTSSPVMPSTSLRLRFDRFLLPRTILRQAFCLRADLAEVPDFTQCQGGVFLHPSYDPVRREIVLRLDAGERLALDTVYKLTLYRSEVEGDCTVDEPTSCGVRAFDGAPLEEPQSFLFRTTASDPGTVPDETAPPADFCGPDGVVQSLGGCGYSPCHSPTKDGPGAAAGLDLTGLFFGDYSALQATAINQVAHQTQMGEHADDIEETPGRFGRSMAIINAFDPGKTGSPGDSYIMYKLLTGPSMADVPDDIRPSDDEMDRLRASVVVGMPMSADGKKLSAAQLLALSQWIASGAPTPSCQ